MRFAIYSFFDQEAIAECDPYFVYVIKQHQDSIMKIVNYRTLSNIHPKDKLLLKVK